MTTLRSWLAPLMIVAPVLLGACGPRGEQAAPEATAIANSKLLYWSQGLRPLNASVCFAKPQASVPDADFDASAAVFRQILEEEWQAASGLQFQWSMHCSPPTPHPDGSGNDYFAEDIRIALMTGSPPNPAETPNSSTPDPGVGCTATYSNGNYGSGPDELETRRSCMYTQVIGLDSSNPVYSRRNTCHEFGHSLGFAHEHNHRDNPQTTCPDGTGTDIRGTGYDVMSVMHYNYDPGAPSATAWYNCPAPGNWGWDLSTRTYSYKGGLSSLDKLGAEMAYPKSMQPLVCGDRTVIPGGQARFQADVVRRGAHIDDTSQSMLQNVVWYVDGNNMGPICGAAGCSASAVELRFPASLIAGGAHTVRLEYDDYWGRHHSSTTPFRVSAVAPPFEGFEGTAIRWTASSGSLARNTARFTEGAASLQVNGSNYITLSGPDFVTSGLSHVGDQILIDVFVPTGQPNRYWLGAVQMSVTVPARAINDGYLGQVELTGLSQGAWHTLRFNVPSNVQQALRAEGLAARFKVSVNTPAGAPALLLDNLRFDGGNLTQRMGVLDPCPALDPTPIPQNTLFSFDVPGDWNVTNATGSVGTIQSRIALEVDAHGYTPIVGASFSTSELSGVSSTLLVDVMLPPAAVSASWQGAVSGFVSCPTAGINNLYIGPVSLTGLPANIFQSLTLTLPAAVVNAFRATNTCSIEIDLNVNAAGPYYFDNLRFGP